MAIGVGGGDWNDEDRLPSYMQEEIKIHNLALYIKRIERLKKELFVKNYGRGIEVETGKHTSAIFKIYKYCEGKDEMYIAYNYVNEILYISE